MEQESLIVSCDPGQTTAHPVLASGCRQEGMMERGILLAFFVAMDIPEAWMKAPGAAVFLSSVQALPLEVPTPPGTLPG